MTFIKLPSGVFINFDQVACIVRSEEAVTVHFVGHVRTFSAGDDAKCILEYADRAAKMSERRTITIQEALARGGELVQGKSQAQEDAAYRQCEACKGTGYAGVKMPGQNLCYACCGMGSVKIK